VHSVHTCFTFSRHARAVILWSISKTRTTNTLTLVNTSTTITLSTQTITPASGEIFMLLNSSISNNKYNLFFFNIFIASGVISKFQTKFKPNQLWKCFLNTFLTSYKVLNSSSKCNTWAIKKGDSGFQSGYG